MTQVNKNTAERFVYLLLQKLGYMFKYCCMCPTAVPRRLGGHEEACCLSNVTCYSGVALGRDMLHQGVISRAPFSHVLLNLRRD